MLELVLFWDFLIRFDAGSSSTRTNMKTHTSTSSDSCSLIKSLAFDIFFRIGSKTKVELMG